MLVVVVASSKLYVSCVVYDMQGRILTTTATRAYRDIAVLVVVVVASFEPHATIVRVVHVNAADAHIGAPLHPESKARRVSNHQVLDCDVGL